MKPFNLERALAGDPVVTRDGRKVLKVLDGRHPNASKSRQVVALVDGNHFWNTYAVDGIAYPQGETNGDLFMATKKREGWVSGSVGAGGDLITFGGGLRARFYTKEEALKHAASHEIPIRIEYEE